MYICPYYPRLASKGSKHKYFSVLVGRLKDLDVLYTYPNVVKNMNVARERIIKVALKKRGMPTSIWKAAFIQAPCLSAG